MLDYLAKELEDLNTEGLLRKPRVISDVKGVRVKIDNRWFITFCTNDYLGLAQHPAAKKAMIQATKKFGAGAGAARLLSGNTALHHQLEQAIARFKGADDGLLFTSGFVANLGVIATLIKKDDIIFCDELNHASLIDASRLSKAELHIYRHRDLAHLEELLSQIPNSKFQVPNRKSKIPHPTSQIPHRYIISDSIFSMDGDAAPLKEIVKLAKKYSAYTIVDEAHGTGVFGRHGRGLTEELSLEKQVDIKIGTLSKALGSVGGFLAGPKVLVDYIRNKARPFIFTTSLPPGVCAGAIECIKLLRPSGTALRRKLWANTKYMKEHLSAMGFDLRGSVSPIIPIMIGDTKKTIDISTALWAKGLYVPAIRPPTVPPGQSRLRVTITAMHSRKDMDSLIDALEEVKG